MKRLLFAGFLSLLVFSCSVPHCILPKEDIKPYVNFIEKNKTSAKDYVLGLFKKYDLVMLCERHHGDTVQYDLYTDILSDPYFIDSVGTLFTEIGVSTIKPELDNLIMSENLSPQEIKRRAFTIQRNASFWPLWEKYNYHAFLTRVYKINSRLSKAKKINWYPSDVPWNWYAIKDTNDLSKLWRKELKRNGRFVRDSIMAAQIIRVYDSLNAITPGKKALIIMNYIHAFNDKFAPTGAQMGRFLFQKYKGKIANVYVNNIIVYKNPYHAIQNGKWDAAFKLAKVEDAGFDFEGSPFGKDFFDYYKDKKNLTYQDVFTGMVFYKPLEKFVCVVGIPGVITDDYLNEHVRRIKILHSFQKRNIEADPEVEKWYYNTKRRVELDYLDDMEKEIECWINQ